MANEATNGEVFLQPLSSIREILERSVCAWILSQVASSLTTPPPLTHTHTLSTVLQQERGRGSEGSEVASGKGAQMALYYLAIEYIPRLLSYMPRIRTNKPGNAQSYLPPNLHFTLFPYVCYMRNGNSSARHSVLPVGTGERESVSLPPHLFLLPPPSILSRLVWCLPGDPLQTLSLHLAHLPPT